MPGTTARTRALTVVLAAAFVVVAGCSDDGDGDAATTTTEATTERPSLDEASTTTTAAGSDAGATTTTAVAPPAEPDTSTTAATVPAAPLGDDPNFEDDRASGAGCSPGGGALPDGWWFGSLTGAATADALPFDLACFFVGQAAIDAAAEDGQDDVPNDVYIRNDNATVRQVPVAADAAAECLSIDGAAETGACAVTEVEGPVWIRVVGGEVDRILEQFFP